MNIKMYLPDTADKPREELSRVVRAEGTRVECDFCASKAGLRYDRDQAVSLWNCRHDIMEES